MTRSEKLAWVGVIALMSLAFFLLGVSKASAKPLIKDVVVSENAAVRGRVDALNRCLSVNAKRPARCRPQGIALMTRSDQARVRVSQTALPRVRRSCWVNYRTKVMAGFLWSERAGAVYPDRYLVARYLNFYYAAINSASLLGMSCEGR